MDIYIVKINFNKITSAQYESLYLGVSKQTQYNVDSKKNFEDKIRTLIGEYYVIKFLGNKVSAIKRNKYGKPYNGDRENFYYNISHSKDRVIIGVSNIGDIGVDVEYIRKINYDNLLFFFHKDEKELLKKYNNDNEKIASFFNLWTIKEAYIKLKGVGLYMELSSFQVEENNIGGWIIKNDEDVSVNTRKIDNYILSWVTSHKEKEIIREFNLENIII